MCDSVTKVSVCDSFVSFVSHDLFSLYINSKFPRKKVTQMDQITFEVNQDYYGNGAPRMSEVIPVVTVLNLDVAAGYWLINAQRRLVQQVQHVITAYNGWDNNRINRTVYGFLQMTDLDDSTKTTSEHNLRVGLITVDKMFEMFNRVVVRYNSDLRGFHVSWSFVIYATSLNAGRGNGGSKETLGLYLPTCRDYQEVSCAAAAIQFWMIMNKEEHASLRHNIRRRCSLIRWIGDSIEFQQTMGWEKSVTFHQILELVGREGYTELRIVIVNPGLMNTSRNSRSGIDYDPEEDKRQGYPKTMYLYYDYENKHYCAIRVVLSFLRNVLKRRGLEWCHDCCYYQCICDDVSRKEKNQKRKRANCRHCGQETYNLSQHHCGYQHCTECHGEYKAGREMNDHRCPIKINLGKIPPDFESGDPKAKQLWFYDIECAIEEKEGDDSSKEWNVDEEGYYFEDQDQLPSHTIKSVHKQVPNLIVYMNVFTGEMRISKTLDVFIQDAIQGINGGNNTFLAHNASGYDNRVLFAEILRVTNQEPKLITRGTKILRMDIGKTAFIDSMLHLPGSLKSLGESYLRGNELVEGSLAKGYFPHLFNRQENFDYVGPIPGKEFFDLTSMCRDERQILEFQEWYDTQRDRQDWCFQVELEQYCVLDVKVGAAIVLVHHREITLALEKRDPRLKISPWHSTTSAGYVHSLILYDREILFGGRSDEDRAESSWCNLRTEEYYFCRKALRGGRTETRIFYHKGEMMDIDICSEYPTVQLRKTLNVVGRELEVLYPVGYPTIEIFDPDFYPCRIHSFKPDEKCRCSYEEKVMKKSIKLRLVEKYESMTRAEMDQYLDEFEGILMVDVKPSKCYHPVLPTFDTEKGKCIFGLEPIWRGVFCSPELKLALRMGYVVTKIYRADRYKMSRSPWSGDGDGGILGFFITMKIRSSGNMPMDRDEQRLMNEYYQTHFEMDLDFGDANQWGLRPAAKLSAKILCNSAWGKHAESVDHEQVKVMNHKSWDGSTDQELLFQSFDDGMNDMTGLVPMDNDYMLVKYKANRKKNSPFLAKSYLPCAVFVPMYGRMMLYNVLNICGMRVVMCDTDSVKVVRPIEDPMMDQRKIEMGSYLGQWEDESGRDPLVEFISLGTKTYGQKKASGKTSFKNKGVCLKRAHQKLINFDVAKEIYFDGKEVYVPQLVFQCQLSKQVEKKNFIKKISFDERYLKGELDRETNRLYPFGWNSFS